MQTRLYFLDNLRTFLIFLVVLIHAGIVYEPILENTWIVSDPAKSSSIGLIRLYLDIFVMFIIFFISGYFIPNSLKRKNNAWEFIASKFRRILLPWIIAVITLIPAYKVIFLYSRGLPQEEWFSYFHFFQRAGTDLSFFANNLSQSWLWFLPVLFLFQVLYLVLSKTNLLSFDISLKTGVLLFLVIGLVYSMIISVSGLAGWTLTSLLDFQRERLLVYFMAFLLGALCYKLHVFESEKNKRHYILANVILTLSLGVFTPVALNLFFNLIDPGRNYFFISGPMDRAMYYLFMLLSMLSFLYIFIHIFRFSFNKSNGLMSQLNQNSYYVYIVHVVVLGVLALVMINIPIPAFVKYLVLTMLTFVVSNIMVYAYRKIFQKTVSRSMVTAVMAAAALLIVTAYVKQSNSAVPTSILQTNPLAPAIGLHEAALQGNLEIVQQHIEAGSDLDEIDPSGGSSPLITAAAFGKTEIALALIAAGADVNFKNNDGSTPLHTAAFFCSTKIVETLLTNGADATIKNNAGSIALESVTAPFEEVKGIYDYFGETLGPLGLSLDYEQIKQARPVIADMLRSNTSK